ncbi:hypothetical protein MY4824_006186 [Beauveria thailandica]
MDNDDNDAIINVNADPASFGLVRFGSTGPCQVRANGRLAETSAMQASDEAVIFNIPTEARRDSAVVAKLFDQIYEARPALTHLAAGYDASGVIKQKWLRRREGHQRRNRLCARLPEDPGSKRIVYANIHHDSGRSRMSLRNGVQEL